MSTAPQPTRGARSRLTSDAVWSAIERASFLVLSYVTPAGEPRSAGVMHQVVGRELYVVSEPTSWKARHIAADGHVAVTVPVRRGGPLSLLLPIPPATISFHGHATVHPLDDAAIRPIVGQLGAVLPTERRDVVVIAITPEGTFTTYGVGVSLARMRDTEAARAHVPVTPNRNRS